MTASVETRLRSSWALPADVIAPSHLWVPDAFDRTRTLGPHVAAICTLAGYVPDPEQRFLLDLAFALNEHGRLLIFEMVVIAPRQNLKTGFLKQYALGQMFVRQKALTAWTAHEFDTVTEAMRDLETIIDGSTDLRDRIARVLHGSSPEISVRKQLDDLPTDPVENPRTIFRTRTKGKGRGISGEPVILDEGFALEAQQLGALLPIMLAQDDPQMVVASSGCRPDSTFLWSLVQRGRAGGSQRMAYVEYCAPEPADVCDLGDACDHAKGRPGCGCDKEDVLRSFHTALARGRGAIQSRWDLRETLPPDEYCMEIMGWHSEQAALDVVIDGKAWADAGDADTEAPPTLGYTLDVSPGRKQFAVAAAGRLADGRFLGFVAEHGSAGNMLARLTWLKNEKGMTELTVDEIVGEQLIEAIEAIGITVNRVKSRDQADAFALLLDKLRDGLFVHLDDPMLNVALAAAGVRDVGDGGRAWRRKGSEDITPLVAVTLALWWVARVGVINAGRGRVIALN